MGVRHGSPRRRGGRGIRAAIAVVSLAAFAVVAPACTPQAPTSSDSEVCAPAGTPLSHIDVEILSAPAGSSLRAEEFMAVLYDNDYLPDWDVKVETIGPEAAGQTLTLASSQPVAPQLHTPDPGKCIRLTAIGGMTYRVTAWNELNPLVILLWNTGYYPQANLNSWGYPPIGSVPVHPPSSDTPVAVTGITDATALVGDSDFSCAIVGGGAVKCWGRGDFGQMGNGTTTFGNYAPVTVTGLTGATAIAAGGTRVCAVVAGGAVTCWGGWAPNSTTGSTTPVAVAGITGASSVAVSGSSACAVVGGGVKCWGLGFYGELGNGTTMSNSATPVDVVGLTDAVSVTAGDTHYCALRAGGTVVCWGHNSDGQLGDGSVTDRSVPVDVTGLTGATGLGAGDDYSCALVGGGAVRCWGQNTGNALGDDSGSMRSTTPVDVVGVSGAGTVDGSLMRTCSAVAGAVECWGSYQVGGPVATAGITDAVSVSTDVNDVCALLAGGGVRCWGVNVYGQLGNEV